MSGDSGDDFSEEIKRTVMDVLQYMRLSSMGRGAGAALPTLDCGSHGKAKDASVRNADDRSTDAEVFEPTAEAEPQRPDRVVVAKDVADAEFLRSVMEENNLEYSVLREKATDGSFEFVFRLPDRDVSDKVSAHFPFSGKEHTLIPSDHPYTTLFDMAKMNSEVIALLDYYTQDRNYSTGTGTHASKAEFTPDAPENFKFDFKTVEWDREAVIITSFLDERNVPYQSTHLDGETVRFCFHPNSAQDVKHVVDLHINNSDPAKRVPKKRFPDYEALTDPGKRTGMDPERQPSPEGPGARTSAHGETNIYGTGHSRDEALSVTVGDAARAQVLKDGFVSENIPFESFREKGTGAERFVVSRRGLASKADRLDRIEARIRAMTPADVKKAAAKSKQQSKLQKNTEESRSQNVQSKEDRGFTTDQRHTPIRDEKTAKRSADARNKAAQTMTRKPTRLK